MRSGAYSSGESHDNSLNCTPPGPLLREKQVSIYGAEKWFKAKFRKLVGELLRFDDCRLRLQCHYHPSELRQR